MSKDDATSFLTSLADKTNQPDGKPAVIMVRSSPKLKTFIAGTLEALEQLNEKTEPTKAPPLEVAFARLQADAVEVDCLQLALALQYADLALALQSSRAASDAEVTASRLGRSLTTLLLRIYVEGHDHGCNSEVSQIRSCLEQISPGASGALAKPRLRAQITYN